MQQDLWGLPLGYECKKCGKGFATMKESSKHHARNHHKRVKKSINFILENYQMTVQTIEVLPIA